MAKSFEGKLVFITGAASGIGRATAIQLSKLGASLILTDVSPTIHRITKYMATNDVITAALDVSDEIACRSFIDQVVTTQRGKLDHVFNCAGINPTAYPLTKTPEGYFDKLFATNVKGVYNVTRAAIPHLQPHAGCSIVNVSSILGVKPAAEMAIYCATKHAVVGFSKAMALELGPSGIRVNVVAPGYIDTPTNASVLQGREAMEESAKGVSLGRMGTPEDVAECVVWLMGEGARYVNGSVLGVDGGRS